MATHSPFGMDPLNAIIYKAKSCPIPPCYLWRPVPTEMVTFTNNQSNTALNGDISAKVIGDLKSADYIVIAPPDDLHGRQPIELHYVGESMEDVVGSSLEIISITNLEM